MKSESKYFLLGYLSATINNMGFDAHCQDIAQNIIFELEDELVKEEEVKEEK